MNTRVFLRGAVSSLALVLILASRSGAAETGVAAETNAVMATNLVVAPPANPPTEIAPEVEEIIKMAQSGVAEGVILAYVNQSKFAYDLSVDEIIYLRDLGIEEGIITAMINHGRELKPAQGTPPEPLASPAPAASSAPVAVVEQPAPNTVAPPEAAALAAPPTTQVTYNYFYSSLAPYGSWIQVSDYGWCWRPTVAVIDSGWRPYSHRGRWLYSDSGWYWHSDYSWGWAPFHYGRWYRHSGHGWVWTPDLVWGPSWVTWRWTDGYCGWAPLPPAAVYRSGLGLHFYDSNVGVSFDFGISSGFYTFVPAARFCDWSPWRYYLPPAHVSRIYNNTTIINNITENNTTIINRGIDSNVIASASRTELRKVAIRDLPENTGPVGRPDRLRRDGSELVVYRPKTPLPAAEGARSAQELRKGTLPSRSESAPAAAGLAAKPAQPQSGRTPLATGGKFQPASHAQSATLPRNEAVKGPIVSSGPALLNQSSRAALSSPSSVLRTPGHLDRSVPITTPAASITPSVAASTTATAAVPAANEGTIVQSPANRTAPIAVPAAGRGELSSVGSKTAETRSAVTPAPQPQLIHTPTKPIERTRSTVIPAPSAVQNPAPALNRNLAPSVGGGVPMTRQPISSTLARPEAGADVLNRPRYPVVQQRPSTPLYQAPAPSSGIPSPGASGVGAAPNRTWSSTPRPAYTPAARPWSVPSTPSFQSVPSRSEVPKSGSLLNSASTPSPSRIYQPQVSVPSRSYAPTVQMPAPSYAPSMSPSMSSPSRATVQMPRPAVSVPSPSYSAPRATIVAPMPQGRPEMRTSPGTLSGSRPSGPPAAASSSVLRPGAVRR